MNLFRLVLYDTDNENKFEAVGRYEYLGNRESIFNLWFYLQMLEKKHVEIYNMNGVLQNPEKGLCGLMVHAL